jgi:hypothetical protein
MHARIISFDALDDASAAPAIIRFGLWTWAWDLSGAPRAVLLHGPADDAGGKHYSHMMSAMTYRALIDALPDEWRRAHLARYLGEMAVTSGDEVQA